MIYSVFCPSADTIASQSDLLCYSWSRARQPGELVHMVAEGSERPIPTHPLARVVETQRWSPHPYTGDVYAPYQMAAALLEWLFVDRTEGTILLLEPTSVFLGPVADEVKPGHARATPWPALPRGEGPFGLGPDFEFLTAFCVDRALDISAVTLPALVHSTDLHKIAARWLELMSIIRAETQSHANGPIHDADKIAYLIAAAEAGITHTAVDFPIVDSRATIASIDGNREFLTVLSELVARRAEGNELALLKPCRQKGVREGKILGSMFLEIPGRAETISLNSSGAAIWGVCDGIRSLAEINRALETRFEMPSGSLLADVEVVVRRLEKIGALRLEPL